MVLMSAWYGCRVAELVPLITSVIERLDGMIAQLGGHASVEARLSELER
jgi:hypothetical protein